MTGWQHLVDLSTELKVTEEGWAALHWATLFHIRGRHSVRQRRESFTVVEGGVDDVIGLRRRRRTEHLLPHGD